MLVPAFTTTGRYREAWIDLTGVKMAKPLGTGVFHDPAGLSAELLVAVVAIWPTPRWTVAFWRDERGNASRLVSGSTSLRMSDLGYQNKAQKLGICFNALKPMPKP